MKTNLFVAVTFLGILPFLLSNQKYANWNVVSDQVSITFESKKAKGVFKELNAEIKFDPENLQTSSLSATVMTASIFIDNETQQKHAIGGKWLDVTNFPKITFSSKEITKSDEGFIVKGDLTILETTNEVEIPFTFEEGENELYWFKSDFSINRADYNFGMKMVSDIKLTFNIPVKK